MIDTMTAILTNIAMESLHILNESSIYILFGLLMAGLLKAFMPERFIAAQLGNGSVGAVVKASLIGIPLPLCSCGVIPAAMGLRKSGASRGATVSFLVSTPETGVDSIAITYALLDPLMTVIRPVSAFITSFVAGIFVNLLPEKPTDPEPARPPAKGG